MQRILIEIDRILEFFSDAEQAYIKNIIDFSTDEIPKKTSFFIFKCARSIDGNTSQDKLTLFIKILEQIFIKDTTDNVDIVHSGEDFFVELRLRRGEDLTGSMILARNGANGNALSSVTLKGTEASVQRIDLLDLDLPVNTFHRINILAEEPDANESASGDSNALVNIVYLFVEDNIDQ